MTSAALLQLLADVERGAVTPQAAAERLATLPFEDIGHTRVDHHRSLRTGLPEVIFAAGKTPEQTTQIFSSLAADGVDVLTTRADAITAEAVLATHPAAIYNQVARTIALRQSTSSARSWIPGKSGCRRNRLIFWGADSVARAAAIFGSPILNKAPARGDSSIISLPRRRK